MASDVQEFRLPDLGEGLEDAEVVTWRVATGETVALNQVLVEVNTAKALVEIPSPWAGVVEDLHANAGDVVRVGEPLVSIRVADGPEGPERDAEPRPEATGGEATGGAEPPREAAPEGSRRQAVLVGYGVEEEEPAPRPASARAGSAAESPVAATPPVRRLAKDLGVDLRLVPGTGPDGRVTREDVLGAAKAGGGDASRAAVAQAAPPQPTAPPPEATQAPAPGTPRETRALRLTPVRRLIAEKMARSAREIPQVTTFLTVDCSSLLSFRDHLMITGEGRRISPLAIIVAALVRTIDDHPKLNASFDADAAGGPQIVLHGPRHIGIATDTEAGLLVPVVRDADVHGIAGLAAEIARLAEAARSGRATPNDLTGSTITVSNVGTFGAEFGTPIINHPEGAILAVGVIEARALVVDGRVEPRPATTLSLTFDHRLMDGAEAGHALRSLKGLLESPFELGSLPR